MLVELALRGLGAIEQARLELGPGFTAVTGETGAGKTMLLTGLGLLLGGRADSSLVRAGHDRAEVEGRFRVDPAGPAARAVVEAGGELDQDELVVRRTVGVDGRSRAYLGGRSVPVAALSRLADHLVAVHGQADQRGLLRPAVQREVLDRYVGAAVAEELSSYGAAYRELAHVRDELAQVCSAGQARRLEADALRQGLREVDEVEPQPGEDLALRTEAARLAHVEALRAAAAAARQLVGGTGHDLDERDVLSLLGTARRELDAVAEHDPALLAIVDRLAEAAYALADLVVELAGYVDGVDADPTRLAAVQERLARLAGLTRRHGGTVDDVLGWATGARRRLAELADDDTLVRQLTERRDELVGTLTEVAGRLSDARRAGAARLDAAVSAELEGLAMGHAALHAEVRHRPDPQGLQVDGRRVAFGPSGVDDVELLLTPHTGAPARPLHRGASGGELSRVMLALELVLSGADPVATFVFDEVDAGVGGRAAVEVGRRLAALATSAQVLVVTHLPQVAAFADRHVVVAKSDDGLVTESAVDLVDGDTRVRELSRMLAGLADSDLARGHAQELLATAAATKSAG